MEKKPVTDVNKFKRILCATILDTQVLLDPNWTWYVDEVGSHKYEVNGYHPVASRILVIKENLIV